MNNISELFTIFVLLRRWYINVQPDTAELYQKSRKVNIAHIVNNHVTVYISGCNVVVFRFGVKVHVVNRITADRFENALQTV